MSSELQRSRQRLVTARRRSAGACAATCTTAWARRSRARAAAERRATWCRATRRGGRRCSTGSPTSAREAVADVRRLVHALRPPTLDELGLVRPLRSAG